MVDDIEYLCLCIDYFVVMILVVVVDEKCLLFEVECLVCGNGVYDYF